MKQIGNIINTFQHGFSVKIAKNFGSLWFTFEPKFRPKPKLPILPEPKPEFRFMSKFRTEQEPNRISVDH